MIKLKSLVSELIVSDLSSGKYNMKYFVAYEGKLFILDKDSNTSKVIPNFSKHPTIKGELSDIDTQDVQDFIYRLSEIAPDIVAGEYYPKHKSINVYYSTNVSPNTSLIVKKIAKQLGVKNVTRDYYKTNSNDDIIDVDYPAKKLVGGIPEVVFHGTNSKELQSILTYGLDPGRGSSRWEKQNIFHEEHVFFTSTFQEATYYAENAVRVEKRGGENFPIVLELTIPDTSLIDPDYDADTMTTQQRTYHQHPVDKFTKSSMKSMGISRETGKWGYKGRIPAKFIKWVYYYNGFQKKWHKSRPDVWKKLLDRYDWETIGYKLGLYNQNVD